MTGYLLDTNVISETRKPRPHGGVVAWLESVSAAEIWLPALVFGEIQAGIERIRRKGPARAASLDGWLHSLDSAHTLPMDSECFRAWARLMHGKPPELTMDGMIAATAQVHGLTIASRNQRDFAALGFRVFNPFEFLKK